MMRPPSVTDVEAAQSHLVLLKSKMRQRRQQADNRIGVVLVGSKKNIGKTWKNWRILGGLRIAGESMWKLGLNHI
jgi:hypothetical protein